MNDIDWQDDADLEAYMAEQVDLQRQAGGLRRVGPGLIGLYVKGLDLTRPDAYIRVTAVEYPAKGQLSVLNERGMYTRLYVEGDHVQTMTKAEVDDATRHDHGPF